MRIRPFQGLRPTPETVNQVASVPYDVVNTAEARKLAAGNALSFLHVVRAEIDLPEDTDPYSEAVYNQAAANFRKLQDQGAFIRESEPCLFLYEQEMRGHVQTGIAATCHIDDYENDIIKKHEKTRKAKEDDRVNVNRALRAHPGPVFLTYRDVPAISTLIAQARQAQPLFEFTASDNVIHRVWRLSAKEAQPLVDAFAAVPCAYVADGHHRSASAWRVGKELRQADPEPTGDKAYDWFLSVIFPAADLNILPYNRLVKDLNGHSPEQFLAALGGPCQVTGQAPATPASSGSACMYLDGRWFEVRFRDPDESTPVNLLDVSRLQDQVLQPLLGITDPRTSDRIEFVGGIRGTEALTKAVDAGEAAVAFSMYPVTVEQLMGISDTGSIMPPKSTWFEPKLRSGLFVHTF